MGGNLFKKPGIKRYTKESYDALLTLVKDCMSVYFAECTDTINLPSKDSYGDMDILYTLKPGVVVDWEAVRRVVPYTDINKNGTFTSILYKDEFQIDFIETKDFVFAKFITAYAGIFNVIGWSLRRFNLKLTDTGLYFVQNHIKLHLSNSLTQVCEFLGLDYTAYTRGFTSETDLFSYVSTCKYLHLPDTTHKNYKRPVFLRMHDFLTDHPRSDCDAPCDCDTTCDKEYILQHFHAYDAYNTIMANWDIQIQIRQYYNGKYISKVTGFTGRALGDCMMKLKQNAEFESTFLSGDVDKIHACILQRLSSKIEL